MKNNVDISVLMSVYKKEKADYFDAALWSVFTQTLAPDEVVLIEDGPLTEDLYKVIEKYKIQYPKILKIHRNIDNIGLGRSLNLGVNLCKNELIARMDTDDIALPTRFQKQVQCFKKNSNLVLCGTNISEFTTNTKNIVSTRIVPEKSNEIYEFCKKRNPFNHVTVMFKKSAILSVGNYQDCYMNEDYYLWARLLLQNTEVYNIQESLVFVRIDENLFLRRGGFAYAKIDFLMCWRLYKMGYINLSKMISNSILKSSVRIMPNRIRELIYKKFLHK